MLFVLVLRLRGGDRIYKVRSLIVVVGLNALFIVLPHWDNINDPLATLRQVRDPT